ncbi:ATP-binding cassette domain-containing protein [Patescibacteria group bacterium]
MIQVKNLSRRFGNLIAVDDVSFSVEKGKIFGLLGPNGAGKTTTIRMLATLLKPTGGTIHIDGKDVVKNQSQVRKRLGLIFQEPSLDIALTARENLRIHGHLYGLSGPELNKNIEEVLEVIELSKRRDDKVKNFSGGMRRRLEVARSILHNPPFLLFDEPTVGLDPQSRYHIWHYLDSICTRYKTTILFTTHYLDEAEKADEVAIIDRGHLIAMDTPQNLKAKIGGNLIRINTDDNKTALKNIHASLPEVENVEITETGLEIRSESTKKTIVKLMQSIEPQVLSFESRSPSLDDVFLKLTGQSVREGDSAASLKAWQI